MSSLDEVCRELVVTWTIGTAGIDAGLEGVLPEFSLRFQRPPQEFTFDAFSTPANESEWEWRAIRFSSLFEREFCFYLPISWREGDGDGFAASIHEGDQVRQSIFVADRPDWARAINSFVTEHRIAAFAYYMLLSPGYDKWLLCSRDEGRGVDELLSVCRSADWGVLTTADASTDEMLESQLASLLVSSPWQEWITAAP